MEEDFQKKLRERLEEKQKNLEMNKSDSLLADKKSKWGKISLIFSVIAFLTIPLFYFHAFDFCWEDLFPPVSAIEDFSTWVMSECEIVIPAIIVFFFSFLSIIFVIIALTKKEKKTCPIIAIILSIIAIATFANIFYQRGHYIDDALLEVSCFFTSFDNKEKETFELSSDEKITISGVSIPLNACEACEVGKQAFQFYNPHDSCECFDVRKKVWWGKEWLVGCGYTGGGLLPSSYIWSIDGDYKTIWNVAL